MQSSIKTSHQHESVVAEDGVIPIFSSATTVPCNVVYRPCSDSYINIHLILRLVKQQDTFPTVPQLVSHLAQKNVGQYTVVHLEFQSSIAVKKEVVLAMFEIIQFYKLTLTKVIVKGVACNSYSSLLRPSFALPFVQICFRNIYQDNPNEGVLGLLKNLCDLNTIKELRLDLSAEKTDSLLMQMILKQITSMQSLEVLHFSFTRYIVSSAFQVLAGEVEEKYDVQTINEEIPEEKEVKIPATRLQIKHLHLDFMNTSLGDKGARYLSQFIARCSDLQTVKLNLRYNRLNESALTGILNELEKHKTTLCSLHLGISSNTFSAKGSEHFCEFFEKLAAERHLSQFSIDMKLFEIANEDISWRLFQPYKQLDKLIELSLNFEYVLIPISRRVIIEFAESLIQMTSLERLTINMSKTNIKEEITEFFGGIGYLSNLKALKLSLVEITFGERRLKALETAVGQLVNLTTLELHLSLRTHYRGVQTVYQDLLKLIDKNLAKLLFLNIQEINDFLSSKIYLSVTVAYQRLKKKTFLRKKLVYSILAMKHMLVLGQLKRKELLDEIAMILTESRYFPSKGIAIIPLPPPLILSQQTN